MASPSFAADTSEPSEIFDFEKVYEYDIKSYDKKSDYEQFKVLIQDENLAAIEINIKKEEFKISNIECTKTVNEEFNTTLITGEGSIDENTSILFRIVYGDKKNENGNAIITEKIKKDKKSKKDKPTYEETFIRYSQSEDISLKEMVEQIKNKNKTEGTGNSSDFSIAMSNPPLCKIV